LRKLKKEEEERFSKWGKGVNGKETLRKPLPTREVQKGRNREMGKKNANAKEINRPRQLYQCKS